MVTAVPDDAALVHAMRVMHCCYCCDDADAAVRFLEEGVGLSARATSKGIRADGSPLGIERTVESDICLVYDPRGGRISPAIEVHGWIDPPAVGAPYDDPACVGIQAIGVTVPNGADAQARLEGLGATPVGRADDDALLLGGPVAVVRAPDGVTFDVVERGDVDGVQLAHLRVTCSDLERSVGWYQALGYTLVDGPRTVQTAGAPFGLESHASVSVARLRLPDEAFGLVLVDWHDPASRGAPYDRANHRGIYRLALGVEDTRAATKVLVDAGCTPTAPPNLIELPGTKVPDMWISFFEDPDGVVVQLVERKRDAFATH
jgi:catechol 2,3-dioxygenase-like lactoylglutathione lyase family enzyme